MYIHIYIKTIHFRYNNNKYILINLCLSSLLNEKGMMGIDMKYRSPNV